MSPEETVVADQTASTIPPVYLAIVIIAIVVLAVAAGIYVRIANSNMKSEACMAMFGKFTPDFLTSVGIRPGSVTCSWLSGG